MPSPFSFCESAWSLLVGNAASIMCLHRLPTSSRVLSRIQKERRLPQMFWYKTQVSSILSQGKDSTWALSSLHSSSHMMCCAQRYSASLTGSAATLCSATDTKEVTIRMIKTGRNRGASEVSDLRKASHSRNAPAILEPMLHARLAKAYPNAK